MGGTAPRPSFLHCYLVHIYYLSSSCFGTRHSMQSSLWVWPLEVPVLPLDRNSPTALVNFDCPLRHFHFSDHINESFDSVSILQKPQFSTSLLASQITHMLSSKSLPMAMTRHQRVQAQYPHLGSILINLGQVLLRHLPKQPLIEGVHGLFAGRLWQHHSSLYPSESKVDTTQTRYMQLTCISCLPPSEPL